MAKIEVNNVVFKIKQGKKGRWRWFLDDKNGVHLAVSAVSGYDTKKKAEKAAMKLVEALAPPSFVDMIFGK